MRRFTPAFIAVLFAAVSLLGCAGGGTDPSRSQRNFPQTALRGALVFGEGTDIAMNGRAAKLAPGARIRDQNNMLVTPASVIGGKYLVHYTVDPLGLVKDVWLLTPSEANVAPWPWNAEEASRWQFDWTAQTWTKP